ncbi:MAG: nucleotide pyrophosphohydrolase [Actinocatenispora sp.]
MDLAECADRARVVRDLYDELNARDRGRTWTREEFALGFVGDVGDLAKLVMAAEGAREVPGGRAALGHELADCLWSVLTLAEKYDVDLAAEFARTMDDLETGLRGRLAGPGYSTDDRDTPAGGR